MNEESPQLSFAKDCYANVQGVLRFLDAKAGAVFTIVGGGSAAIISAHALEFGKVNTIGDIEFAHTAVCCAFLSLISALRVLWPTHGPDAPNHFSWLYPTLAPKCHSKRSEFKPPSLTGMTAEELVEAHELQLQFLGAALRKKTTWLRCSIRLLICSLVFAGLHGAACSTSFF